MMKSQESSGRTGGKATGKPRASGAEPRAVACGELVSYLEGYLEVQRFADYCPNGLQVEGTRSIFRIVTGVTASAALIRAARDAGAQAILVHHGYFWRGEDPRLVGTRRQRVAMLLESGINLLAYHLPLDAHPEVGNNARFGALLGWRAERNFGAQDLGCLHELARPIRAAALGERIARALGREPLILGDPALGVRRVAWCTGAAQDMLEDAIAAGADAFVSGEASERTTHLAREAGVAYFAAGHHATERLGVQALGAHLARRFGVDHVFVDDPNPV